MSFHRVRLIVVIAVLGLVFAACGDSGLPSDEPTSTTGAGLLGGSDDTIPVTVADVLGLSDECEAIANLFLAMVSVFSGGNPAASLSAIDGLPGNLQDDAEVMINAFNAYSEGLQNLGVDLSDPTSLASLTEAQQAEFQALSELVDTEEFNQASENLGAYGEAECADFDPLG